MKSFSDNVVSTSDLEDKLTTLSANQDALIKRQNRQAFIKLIVVEVLSTLLLLVLL